MYCNFEQMIIYIDISLMREYQFAWSSVLKKSFVMLFVCLFSLRRNMRFHLIINVSVSVKSFDS